MKISVIIFSAFILLSSLLPKMDTMELSKVPHLLQHYMNDEEHQGESFTDFIADHYGTNNHNHKDDHKDTGCLPFQDDCSCVAPVFIVSFPVIITHQKQEFSTEKNTLYIEPITSDVSHNIWNPPKS